MATVSRTFSFRADRDFAERHERALKELDRLRVEQPRLADSVHRDFDVRLLEAQRHGLETPAQRIYATIAAFVEAVEEALADEPLIGTERMLDEDALAGARAAAAAVARSYEREAAA
jgi:hypothetical protein